MLTAGPPPRTVAVEPQASGFFSGIRRIFAFLAWILTGFGLVGYFTRRKTGATKAEEIVVYTVHQSFYLWAIILVGFVASACVNHWPALPLSVADIKQNPNWRSAARESVPMK